MDDDSGGGRRVEVEEPLELGLAAPVVASPLAQVQVERIDRAVGDALEHSGELRRAAAGRSARQVDHRPGAVLIEDPQVDVADQRLGRCLGGARAGTPWIAVTPPTRTRISA